MKFIIAVLILVLGYYLTKGTSAPLVYNEEEEDNSFERIKKDKKFQNQVFEAMDASFNKQEQIVFKNQDIHNFINSNDQLQIKILGVFINQWNQKRPGSRAEMINELRAVTQDDPHGSFQSMRDLLLKLPHGTYSEEKKALLAVMFDLEFEGSKEEERRLSLDYLSDLEKLSSNQKLEDVSAAYEAYLNLTDVSSEALAQTQFFIDREKDEVVRNEILSIFERKFPDEAVKLVRPIR